MAIAPKCDVVQCGQELKEFGALLFSAPDANGLTKKQHVCVHCYAKMQQQYFGARA